MVAISLSALVHYMIFGSEVLVWATVTPMQVFFLNATLSQQADRKLHMLGFAISSSLSVGFFTFLAQKALDSHSFSDVWWLGLPILCLTFFVGMSRAYSLDTYRMFVPVVVNSLVAAIYVDSNVVLPIIQTMLVVFSSAMIGIVIGFLLLNNPGNYGKYTQVYYPLVLSYLRNMVKYLDSKEDFARYKELTFTMIHNIKQTLHTKSSLYNDNYMIKNIKRAIFYIYRIEDIYLMVSVLPQYQIYQHISLQYEIVYNLNELSKIFAGRIPKMRRDEADLLIATATNDSKELALHNIIKILYSKLESFCRVGEKGDPAFNPPAKKDIKDVFRALNYKNATFRFSVKYSLAIGFSLILATLLNINRGIWISLGIVSVVRPSVGGMQNISKEYLISATIGIVMGVILSVFTTPFIFYLLFGILIFFVVYLRVFPFWLWSGFMMCAFVMMYSIMYDDFLLYVFDRLLDIGIGIIFAIIVFKSIWPRFSHDNLKPILNKEIVSFGEILALLRESLQHGSSKLNTQSIQAKHAELLHNIEELKNTLKDSKSENAEKDNQIIIYGADMIKVLESIIVTMNELIWLFTSSEYNTKTRELYCNDLKILQNRFEMIENLMSNTTHYFRFEVTNMFMSEKDTHFANIAHQIFQEQNQLYKLLNERHISVPN
ncbi:hypothetical protein CQA53_07470 [Helicobacter didelphidarum]|uniref:Integral membrane bound transporter domain-containing protein n=2 Tax=Helicobacter didelphidarum TaxID=2040648 RepID=A0A3D8IJ47_9HELI|nr:hypothetical protein CQA53_07470 [Helicobacter didelphidarum]